MRQVIRVLKTPVTLIILLAMLGYGAVWGYTHLTAPEPRKEQTCVMTDVGANLTPDRVTVRVLNGGEEGGLAKRMSLFLRAHGFRVVFFNNAPERVPNTVILDRKGNVRYVHRGYKPGEENEYLNQLRALIRE